VGTVGLKAGDTLYLYAGGSGKKVPINTVAPGGFNGGGSSAQSTTSPAAYAGSGGGATDIRINADSLYARVIVAGGGGGSATFFNGLPYGGHGGGLSGTETDFSRNTSGTQNAGGKSSSTYADPINGKGSFGNGGYNAKIDTPAPGGGGGGWYGGSEGALGAGGGSGWIYTSSAYSAWNNTTDKPLWLLTSDYYLADAKTVAGNLPMPDPLSATNGTITGKTGGGFIRITYLGQ
jgi:hypothetical protein